MKTKREYFQKWVADNLTSNDRLARQWQGQKKLVTSQEAGRDWGWKSKAFLVSEWGEVKFKNKLKSGRLMSRADPDTLLEDEDNAEFKWNYDHGSEMETHHKTCFFRVRFQSLEKILEM